MSVPVILGFVFASICSIGCSIGFGFALRFFRKRFGQAESLAVVAFGVWIFVLFFVIPHSMPGLTTIISAVSTIAAWSGIIYVLNRG